VYPRALPLVKSDVPPTAITPGEVGGHWGAVPALSAATIATPGCS
jgi:hypothetical protein